jgi:hypothetical protein
MELEDPSQLDKPFCYWDGEYGWTVWGGKLEIYDNAPNDERICLSSYDSEAVAANDLREKVKQESLRPPVPVDPKIVQAREAGLLPD